MILHTAQSQIAKDKHRFRVTCCGRRFGKTSLAVQEMLAKAFAQNERKVVYIAPTFQQARDIAWQELKKSSTPILESINESRLELKIKTQYGGISSLWLRGWEAVETLRGQHFDFMVIDEIASMRNWWENWHEVVRPTLTDTCGEVLFISTPKGFNHFYDLFNLENTDSDYKSFHFTSYDNPHVPHDELDKARLELTEDRFAQEYLADFRKTEGLVYKEFNRQQHIFTDENTIPRRVERLCGVDWGYTNPAAAVVIDRDYDNHFWVIQEYYQRQKTTQEIIEYIRSFNANAYYPDPAEPDRLEDCRRAGLNVRDVSKDVVAGIDAVRNLFKAGRIHIHSSCVNLIQELETYSYKPKLPQQNEPETPWKENDHACLMAGTIVNGRRIEDIGVCTGIRDVWEYEIGGERLRMTSDHRILTQRGFVESDALRYDDVIWQKQKFLFTRVSSGNVTPIVAGEIYGLIIAATRRMREAKDRDFIDSYGKKRTAKSLLGFIFTTLMATPSTIHWIISLLLTAVNTCLDTCKKMIEESNLVKTLKPLFKKPLSGLRQRLAKKDEKNSENKTHIICSIDQSLSDNATCAEKCIQQKVTEETDSVISTVVKKHYVGRVPVFNVKTRSGMYNANGIALSNCDALRYCLFMQSNRHDAYRAKQFVPTAVTYRRTTPKPSGLIQ